MRGEMARAVHRAARTFECNPVGQLHAVLFDGRRTDAAKRASAATSDTALLWLGLHAYTRTLRLIRPFTDGLEAVLGSGAALRRPYRARQVARCGFQVDGLVPKLVARAVPGAAYVGGCLGRAVACVSGNRQHVGAGAVWGAYAGALLAWGVNQGLVVVTMYCKFRVVRLAAWATLVVLIWEGGDQLQQTHRTDGDLERLPRRERRDQRTARELPRPASYSGVR